MPILIGVLAQFGIQLATDLLPILEKQLILPAVEDLLALAAKWIHDALDPVTIVTLAARMIANIAAEGALNGEDAATIADDEMRAVGWLLLIEGMPDSADDVTAAYQLAKAKNAVDAGLPVPNPTP